MKNSNTTHLRRSRLKINHDTKRLYITEVNTPVSSCGTEQMYDMKFRDFNKMYLNDNLSVCKKCLIKRNDLMSEVKELRLKGYR
tara:strand:- start:91 stop:342 length:252 start_codon:yes stop_codon:yes gene_type:complete